MKAKLLKFKSGLWMPNFISVIGLLLIVFIAAIVEKNLNIGFNKNLLSIISVIIAIIPSMLWLTVFYRQDRLNPEPKSYVFKTLILGALVQKALYVPMIEFIFPDGGAAIAGKYAMTIILVAIIQETVKLLSVRYSIYSSSEFDERVDGIIYGSALGLGFASMTSIDQILANNGAMLTNVTCLVVIETFAHASITGLSGYMLGVSKHEKLKILRLPAAVLIASALNAVTQFLMDAVVRNGFEVNYIIGLIPAALVAVLVFSVLVILSYRSEIKDRESPSEILEPSKAFVGVLPVWLILTVVLATGFITGHTDQNLTIYNVDNIIDLKVPSDWIQIKDEENVFKAGNIIKSGEEEFVSVKKFSLDRLCIVDTNSHEELLQNAAAAWSIKSGLNFRFYESEKGYYLNTKGKETYVIDYIYIGRRSGSGNLATPSIAYGRDVISIFENTVYITTISSSYEDYILNKNILNEIQYTFVGN